jgi:hypothetical protein
MKPNAGLLVALLSYNWKGLFGAVTVTYSGAFVGIEQLYPPTPDRVSAVLAGFVAAGTAVGFFVQTFKPTMTFPLQLTPMQTPEPAEPVSDLPPASVMPTMPIPPVTPIPTMGQASTEQLLAELQRRMGGGQG